MTVQQLAIRLSAVLADEEFVELRRLLDENSIELWEAVSAICVQKHPELFEATGDTLRRMAMVFRAQSYKRKENTNLVR